MSATTVALVVRWQDEEREFELPARPETFALLDLMAHLTAVREGEQRVLALDNVKSRDYSIARRHLDLASEALAYNRAVNSAIAAVRARAAGGNGDQA